jgi:ABC-type transporter Mla subunit MlaD
MAMQYLKKDVWIGVFVIAAVVMLIATFVYYKGLNPYARTVYLEVDAVSNLAKGLKVVYKGYEVGLLHTINFLPESDRFRLGLTLKDDFKIYQGTQFELKGLGLIGGNFINVVLPADRSTVLEGDVTFQNFANAGSTADLGQMFDGINKTMKSVLEADLGGKLNSMVAQINKLSGMAERLANHLEGTLRKADGTLNQTGRQMGSIMGKAEGSVDSLNQVLHAAKGMIGDRDQGAVKVLASLDQTLARLQRISANVDDLTDQHKQDLSAIIVNLKDASASLNYLSKHPRKFLFGGKVPGLAELKADSIKNAQKEKP